MEDKKEMLEVVKQVPQVLSMIYQDLAQPGVKKVGIALETVLEFSTSFLLPLKLQNEKFKMNFEKRLNEYKSKMEDVPDEEICNVNPQVGTPIIDKLSYTTNEEIADLFTNLLVKASSIKNVNLAHPSFVQLIERLSVDEARIIKYLENKNDIPSISFRVHLKDGKGFFEDLKNGTKLQFEIKLEFPENIKTYLDNLTSMGVLDKSHGLYKKNDKIYEDLLVQYGFEEKKKKYSAAYDVEEFKFEKSYYGITDFGKTFIKACNKDLQD